MYVYARAGTAEPMCTVNMSLFWSLVPVCAGLHYDYPDPLLHLWEDCREQVGGLPGSPPG